jgi:hypothetical protein
MFVVSRLALDVLIHLLLNIFLCENYY